MWNLVSSKQLEELHSGAAPLRLRQLNIPSVRTIEACAFCDCSSLTDTEFGKGLETIGPRAFEGCPSLRASLSH